jgi:hypothetical protein
MSRLALVALTLAACSARPATPASGSGSASASASASASLDSARPEPVRPERRPSAELLDRVAVIGASVSAGLAAPPIAASLRAGLPATADVLDAASVFFFQDPFANGEAQVAAAAAHRPTLTLAVDFLFWFAYASTSPDGRRQRLEGGLALLAALPGTVVVGDLPDMRNANESILGPAAVPSPTELTALNAQIRAWAAARPHTVVLPLAAWTAPLVTGEDIELAPGERVPARDLMFFDGLHANALGTWHLLGQLDRALERDLAIPADALRLARPSL